jgi:hypothetical protein
MMGHQTQRKCPADEQAWQVSGRHALSDLIEVPYRGNQNRLRDFRRRFQGSLPITDIEPPAAFPADDELLFKSLKGPTIEAVCFNGTGDPVFAGV